MQHKNALVLKSETKWNGCKQSLFFNLLYCRKFASDAKKNHYKKLYSVWDPKKIVFEGTFSNTDDQMQSLMQH